MRRRDRRGTERHRLQPCANGNVLVCLCREQARGAEGQVGCGVDVGNGAPRAFSADTSCLASDKTFRES